MAYVPLSVRESPRFSRKRIGWGLKGCREVVAIKLAPWLGYRRTPFMSDTQVDGLQAAAACLSAWVEYMENNHPLLVPLEVSAARQDALDFVDKWTKAMTC